MNLLGVTRTFGWQPLPTADLLTCPRSAHTLHNDCVYYEVIAVIYFEKVHLPCMHSSLVCIFATEMALYNTCDVSPLICQRTVLCI